MPEQPDSKRGRVRTIFRKQGEEGALEFGQTLGIKPARLKRWFKLWAEGTTPQRGEPLQVKTRSKTELTGKQRVYLFDELERTGTLIQSGPEQSLIRWDNGNEVIASNAWFKPLPPEQDHKRRFG